MGARLPRIPTLVADTHEWCPGRAESTLRTIYGELSSRLDCPICGQSVAARPFKRVGPPIDHDPTRNGVATSPHLRKKVVRT